MRNIPAILGAAFVIACCLSSGLAARSAEPATFFIAQETGYQLKPPEVPREPSAEDDKSSEDCTQCQSKTPWWPLLLLVPGVVGLWIAAAKEHWFGPGDNEGTPAGEEPSNAEQDPSRLSQNRFIIAAMAGTIWGLTLLAMAACLPALSPENGAPLFHLYHSELGFSLFVPILGYIGALLYVLDLSRRGREDIPQGTEFGMRLIMGPYVAIVMVLFAENIGLLDANEPFGQGILAFFSGLLVVIAFQGLVEKGQEVLGSWRENARYAPSEIAKKFELTKQEDLDLRKAGLRHLSQLRARSPEALKNDANRFGLDEDFMRALKKDAQKIGIKKAVGNLAWEALAKTAQVETIEDFAHLNNATLAKVATENGKIEVNGLKALRDEALSYIVPEAAQPAGAGADYPESGSA